MRNNILDQLDQARKLILSGEAEKSFQIMQKVEEGLAQATAEPESASAIRDRLDRILALAAAAQRGVTQAEARLAEILKSAHHLTTYDRSGKSCETPLSERILKRI
ncbi:hypothetical protein [Paracoccus jiaweipingae]|uniref:hypothetical protein n=1 Tax=unclassified Paracoccus (in: a-proteobacteria) TaxID=2688777 RepID=UPI0037957A91